MYIYKLNRNKWKKVNKNGTNSSNSFVRQQSNKKTEPEKAATMQ